MANNHSETERRLWTAADEFRANSELRFSEYSTPVLGLIFLRDADHRFIQEEKELEGKGSGRRSDWRRGTPAKVWTLYSPAEIQWAPQINGPDKQTGGDTMTVRRPVIEVMDDETASILRMKTEVERMKIANRMWKLARVILRSAIRTEHSDCKIEQVNHEIARRISHGVLTHETR